MIYYCDQIPDKSASIDSFLEFIKYFRKTSNKIKFHMMSRRKWYSCPYCDEHSRISDRNIFISDNYIDNRYFHRSLDDIEERICTYLLIDYSLDISRVLLLCQSCGQKSVAFVK